MIQKKDFVTPPTGLRIIQDGVFDLNRILKEVKLYLFSRKYKVHEKDHTEKMKDTGLDVGVELNAEREVNEYIMFNIKIKFRAVGLKKIKLQNRYAYRGFLEVRTYAFLNLDYKDNWRSKPLGNMLFFIYNNYIIKNKILEYEDKNYKELEDIRNIIKSILEVDK